MNTSLKPGSLAPTFAAPMIDPKTGESTFDLAHHRGKTVVLFFYPKDDTSGCTQEAIEFSALTADFADRGALVVGISRDAIKSHANFIAKHDLAVPLVSDEAGAATDAYGVWVEKSMYGRKYMGVERSTFIVGPDGKISAVWRKVKVPGHAATVFNHLGKS
jgi:peroxiredoxin Q/BCP